MAKKQKPWGIDPKAVKQETTKSIQKKIGEEKKERKILKVYEEAHRRAKFMAFQRGMKLTEFMEHLINQEWEKSNPK